MSNSEVDWGSFVRVKSKWIDNLLLTHSKQPAVNGKIVVRAYSIRFAGTREHMDGLVKYMRDAIVHYVYSKDEIERLRADEIEPWPESRDYFCSAHPDKDGKCGELLLYLFVEAVLQVPMVAHKIKLVTDNRKDQVKGSDGIFFGKYRGYDCLLLGEAKMHKTRNGAIQQALTSVNKFYETVDGAQATENELCIIDASRANDLADDPRALDYLKKIINVKSSQYMELNKVHPVIIVYNDNKISDIEIECLGSNQGNEKALSEFKDLADDALSTVRTKIKNWKELQKVYLDFFFMPVTSVSNFRNKFFKALTNTEYHEKTKKTSSKKRKEG